MPRVLMGEFEAMVRRGLREIFERDGSDVTTVETTTEEILDRLVEIPPDVVLLDLDGRGGEALARQIVREYPAVTVIACSSATPEMRIFPPFHDGESYRSDLTPALLVAAIRQRG